MCKHVRTLTNLTPWTYTLVSSPKWVLPKTRKNSNSWLAEVTGNKGETNKSGSTSLLKTSRDRQPRGVLLPLFAQHNSMSYSLRIYALLLPFVGFLFVLLLVLVNMSNTSTRLSEGRYRYNVNSRNIVFYPYVQQQNEFERNDGNTHLHNTTPYKHIAPLSCLASNVHALSGT